MSTPTVTITRQGPETVPFAYTLSAKEAFEPSSINVTFDGSGAGGSFLACCSFYSQDGSLIARCPAPQAITAGDIAEVSYFPLAPSAATPFTPQSCAVFSANPFGVFGPGNTLITWNSIQTNASSLYSIDAGTPTRLLVQQPGYYLLTGSFLPIVQPTALTGVLSLVQGGADFVGTPVTGFIGALIDEEDGTVAQPQRVTTLAGSDYLSLPSGLVYPVHLTCLFTDSQAINVASMAMFVTRLSPSAII